MRIASIDIGTNTFLLLIADFDSSAKINVIRHEQRIPRIGKDVDKEGNIGLEAFKRAADILIEYKNISIEYHANIIIATGTSALRDANNKHDFLGFIKDNSGIEIEILSGEDEAKWSYRGAMSNFPIESGRCTVIDIGGGSTEIIIGEGKEIVDRKSLNIGSVRLTERFFHSDPRQEEEIEKAEIFIEDTFAKFGNYNLQHSKLVGVAGTVTTLAAYNQNLDYIDPKKIAGYNMKYDTIKEMFNSLKKKSVLEISKIACIPEGRADVILAGTQILMKFMDYFKIKEIKVSERGLRYGIAIREWEKAI
jgi:exopolyphosphatase/guanosine-5'-triphosphate,3'-diphosphate pyrophosphatase